jgi:hypothetical protein
LSRVFVANVIDTDDAEIMATFAGATRDDVVEQLADWCSKDWLECDMVNDHDEPAHLPGPCNQQKVDYYFNYWSDRYGYSITNVFLQEMYVANAQMIAAAQLRLQRMHTSGACQAACCQPVASEPLNSNEVAALQLLFRGKAREKFF